MKETTIPWLPGMRGTDAEMHEWRRTEDGRWVDDTGHGAEAPVEPLKPDFTDLATGTMVQWLVDTSAKEAADPMHPDNVMRTIKGEGG
jgi:hypothetical protein